MDLIVHGLDFAIHYGIFTVLISKGRQVSDSLSDAMGVIGLENFVAIFLT